jgi:hypothetical protein
MSFNKQKWLKTVKHTIHSDGSISVQGDVNLYDKKLTELPFKFRKVTGNFDCSRNQLTSLNDCPASVDRNFYCSHNQLTSLNGGPSSVGGNFYCIHNKLTSLNGCPSSVGGSFNCYYNLKDFTKLDIENAMRASRTKNSLSSQALETFSDIIDEL